MDLNQTLTLLTSKAKLDRDKGLRAFETAAASTDFTSNVANVCDFILNNTSITVNVTWEVEHGSLCAAKVLISTLLDKLPPDFCTNCEDACFRLMADKEYRVRDLAAEVIGVLANKLGTQLYERRREVVLSNVRELLEPNPEVNESEDPSEANNRRQRRCASPSPTRDFSDGCDADMPLSSSPGRDMESLRKLTRQLDKWKALEVWIKCLHCILDGLGVERFQPYVDDQFLEILFNCLNHKDRYVRETGFQIIASLTASENSGNNTVLHEKIVPLLRDGLSDNWSHVRMAACVASRNFFQSLLDENQRHTYYPFLLPPLCLNRYHLAEGVRLYSQDTWTIVTKGEGKQLVEKYLPAVVDFYIEQCEAKNHAVREASISCISELVVKMDKGLVCNHVQKMLETLIVCFNDDSWPVRDGACQACGKFIATFPEECRSSVDKMIELMGDNLRDNIPSVRAGAASALGLVAKTYKGDVHAQIVEKYLFAGLQAVEDQPDEAHRFSHQNDIYAAKMDQTGDACNAHLRRFCRAAEPWEFTDGAVCLFVEVSNLLTPAEVSKAVELVVAATSRRDYSQHSALLATLCKQLPELAKKLGKQAFKAHLESFFDPLFYCIDQQHLALVAGENCIVQLCQLIGPSVFRGRVQMTNNPTYLRILDRLIPPAY